MECGWARGSNSLSYGDYNTAVYWELSACTDDRLCCCLSEAEGVDNHWLSNISMYNPVICVINTCSCWKQFTFKSGAIRNSMYNVALLSRECGIPGPIQGRGPVCCSSRQYPTQQNRVMFLLHLNESHHWKLFSAVQIVIGEEIVKTSSVVWH